MTRDEAIKHGKEQLDIFGGEHQEFIEMAIKVLEQRSCEDCISRVEALKAIEKEKQGWEGSERYAIDECHSRIAELPSVTPRQKVGKWTPHIVSDKYESIDHDVCSECQTCFYGERTWDWKFCPNCVREVSNG